MPVRRPAIPDHGGRVEKRRDPCILPHAVLGLIHQLAVRVVPSGFSRFACHDDVGPPTPTDAGEEVAHGARDVGETDRDGGETVRCFGKGPFHADVGQVQRTKRDADVVDGDEHGREPEIEKDLQWIDQRLLQEDDPFARRLLHRSARAGRVQFGPAAGRAMDGISRHLQPRLLHPQRFWQSEQDEYDQDESVHGEKPLRAPPSQILDEQTPDDGTHQRAQQGTQIENSHRLSALSDRPDICNGTCADRCSYR